MEEIIINSLYNFKIDDKSKTIFLSKNHLKETDKKILKLGGNMLYHIGYSSVKKFIQIALESYEKQGYKMVFEYEGSKILLRFNR